MTTISRRTFLAAASAVMAGAGAWVVEQRVGWRRLWRFAGELDRLEGFWRAPLARLEAHFSWLPVHPEAYAEYLEDYQEAFGPIGRFSLPRPTFHTAFLLSTDFFNRPPTPDAPVRYVAFYDPQISPCVNPLAQPPPSDDELARLR
ncbi:MAG: hypothetical protein R2745_14790 [Vicinamibacterales bacterium]